MSTPIATQWQYLDRKPGSVYRQLFLKDTRIMARILYGMYMSDEEPMTVEQIAADYNLPVEAVREAIKYCQSEPPEIQQDWEMEEASIRAMVKNNPNYLHPRMTNPPQVNP